MFDEIHLARACSRANSTHNEGTRVLLSLFSTFINTSSHLVLEAVITASVPKASLQANAGQRTVGSAIACCAWMCHPHEFHAECIPLTVDHLRQGCDGVVAFISA
jgi:hypothetical protein